MREMKNSGIPWIGTIPASWKTDSIGSLYSPRNEKVSDKDFPPLSVGKMGVVPQLATAAKTDDGDNRKLVRIGDFAINSRSDRRGSCGISEYDGSVSLINTIMTPRTVMNPRFYNWLFHTESFADEFYKWGHGIVDDLWTTRWQEMKRIAIVVPSLPEQKAIADFLDRKCSQIDELISFQEKMIEELKAYKQSVITEAVTKGLNPNASMKESGVEWMQQLPSHWQISRLKYFITIKSGDYIDVGEIKDDGEFEVYGGGEIIGYTNKGNALKNSLLIGRVGARCGCVRLLSSDAWATDNALVVTSTIEPQYSFYLFSACDFNKLNTSNAQPLITGGKVKNYIIPIPPINERQEIVKYLDDKCSGIDSIISLKQEKIEMLKEYKKSIMYEYVTGKKEIEA